MAEKVWATKADVATLTGATVSDAKVAQAQAAIETVTGIVVDEAAWALLSAPDARWLRNAVAYQAAFMAASPDYFERQRITSGGQDGQSATFAAEAHELAPMARKALRKLSWKGSRVVQLAAPAVLDADVADDRLPWRPIG